MSTAIKLIKISIPICGNSLCVCVSMCVCMW